MNVIRSKKDIEELLLNFKKVANYDPTGEKHYIVFNDNDRNGQWTVMKYDEATYSVHGKGESYCDKEETFVSIEDLQKMLWENRKAVNKLVREARALMA